LKEEIAPKFEREIKVAYCFIDNSFGRSLYKRAKIFFKENPEFKLVLAQAYKGLALDYRALLFKIKAANPDILIFSSYLFDGLLLAKEASQMGIRPFIFCATAGGQLSNRFAKAPEGYFVSGPHKGDILSKVYSDWEKSWVEFFGYKPGTIEAEGYSAIQIIAKAAEKIVSWDDPSMAREEMKQALKRLEFYTVFGHVRFDDFNGYKNQNPAYNLTVVYQWQQGRLYCVWPKEVAQRPYMLFEYFVYP